MVRGRCGSEDFARGELDRRFGLATAGETGVSYEGK